MGKLSDFATDLQKSPVVLVTVIDVLFLLFLIYVFKTPCAEELRTVIKDAFIGWNGALALSINIINKENSTIRTDVTNGGTTTSTKINTGDESTNKS